MSFGKAVARIRQLVGIGTTKTTPNDAGNIQTVQAKVNDLDVRDSIPVAYHFGFSAALPVGSEVVVLTITGDPSSGVIIASNNQSLRFKNLQPGESVLYDGFGKSIWLKQNGGIVIEAANVPVTIAHASNVTINASGVIQLTAPSIKLN